MCDIGTRNKDSIFFKQLSAGENHFMELETCRKLISDIADFEPAISISGVEPLLHPELASILETIKNKDLYLSVSTNGILLEQHADMFAQSGVDEIVISIDGTEDVHNSIRGLGVYKKVLAGIRKLKRAVVANPHRRIRILVNCCISDKNYSTLSNFARETITNKDIDAILFTFMYFVTEKACQTHNAKFHNLGETSTSHISGVTLTSIDTGMLWDQIQEIKNMPFSHKISFTMDMKSPEALRNYFHAPETTLGKKRCLIPWNRATILHNGDCIIHNRCIAYTTGNILKLNFRDIWNGPLYRAFRTRLFEAGLFPACARCCGVIAND
jgi:sulfatase maturation enzyme AslB (radical SAM superfamily)